MRLIFAILFVSLASVASAGELVPVPNIGETGFHAAYNADTILVVRNGRVIKRLQVDAAEVMTVYGPRGGSITFCPPGGCPPRNPTPPAEPPKFDFPDDEPDDEPIVTTPSDGGSLVGTALIGGAVLGGLAAGYLVTRPVQVVPLDDEDSEEADSE